MQHVESRNTYDFDFQQELPTKGRHDLMWGMEYRYSVSDTEVTEWTHFDGFRINRLTSAFVQDEITLEPQRKYLQSVPSSSIPTTRGSTFSPARGCSGLRQVAGPHGRPCRMRYVTRAEANWPDG